MLRWTHSSARLERLPHMQEVPGSSPGASTKFSNTLTEAEAEKLLATLDPLAATAERKLLRGKPGIGLWSSLHADWVRPWHRRMELAAIRSRTVLLESRRSVRVRNDFRKSERRSFGWQRPDLAPSFVLPALPSRRSFCAPEQYRPSASIRRRD
jgi:hypothetical protein